MWLSIFSIANLTDSKQAANQTRGCSRPRFRACPIQSNTSVDFLGFEEKPKENVNGPFRAHCSPTGSVLSLTIGLLLHAIHEL